MTHAEQILRAVATLVSRDGNAIFSREEIRHQAGIDRESWDKGYSAIFQGMRADHPGGAPNLGEKYKNIFRQVSHGKHTLTDYGQRLVSQING
jgi:hypothetical protein